MCVLSDCCVRYEEFCGEMMGDVEAWPAVVDSCVQRYDSALCQCLRVERRQPPAREKVLVDSGMFARPLSDSVTE